MAELLVLLGIVGLFASFGYDGWRAHCGTRDGLNDAEIDIESDHPRWMLGGKRQSWDAIVERLFRERYGVGVSRLFECCPTTYQSRYAEAYNECIGRHIRKAFPTFSAEELFADAHREWVATVPN